MKRLKEILKEFFDDVKCEIICYLWNEEYVNDFNLALDLGLKPALVRRTLNEIYLDGYLEYKTKREGKLICVEWMLNKGLFVKKMIKNLENKKAEYSMILEREDVYYCPKCYFYENPFNSYDYGFLCPKCEYQSTLIYYDKNFESYLKNKISKIKKYIKYLERYK